MVKSRRGAAQSTSQTATGEGIKGSRCRIMVLGIGSAGNSTVSRLVEEGLKGAECVAISTDLRDLNSSSVSRKVLIGERVTHGLSTAGDPEIGRIAVEESMSYIEDLLENADVVFVAAGLGGGTGTGAAPVVAESARHKGAVVVGVVTTPLVTEVNRIERAAQALNKMRRVCDTVVVIEGNKIRELASQASMTEVFKLADRVLANMIKGIVETLTEPSLINLDFADFKHIIKKGGIAVVGVGESATTHRAEEAVRNALKAPLLNVDCANAKGAIIHVSGDPDMTIEEVNKVGKMVTEAIGHKALVSWSARVSPQIEGSLKVTLVMTGLRSPYLQRGFRNIIPSLYDIESSFPRSGKSLPTDLGLDRLDQIENFED